jgi:hypothetical protein
MRILLAGVLAVWVGRSYCGQAMAATFTSQPILVDGSPAVNATGINDKGTIIGTFGMAGQASETTGFVLDGSSLSVLGNALPTAINDAGTVAGITSSATGFIWRNGAFVPGITFPVERSVIPSPQGPFLNARGEVAYTLISADGAQIVYAGTPKNPHLQRALSQQFAIVTSIADDGTIAGLEYASIGGQIQPVIFSGKAGLFDIFNPVPTGQISGGYATKGGRVAFSTGTAVLMHTDANGNYATLFAPPQGSDVQVSAINNAGRVAGTYVDGSQTPAVRRVFYTTGSTVATFGPYSTSGILIVAMNNRGAMVISDAPTLDTPPASTLVRCHGTGC